MKNYLLFGLLLFFLVDASAQTNGNKKKKAVKKAVVKKSTTPKTTETVVLTNTSANSAFASSNSRFKIYDPTINALNEKAAGSTLEFTKPSIPQMPKGTYGFANGKIFLRSTTATSPGTGYGSGAVGTGTSIQSIGTSEATIGVNGKNPYAGPWLWGANQPGINLPSKAGGTTKN